jgi:RNAse (barnase) inhibitor barstar
MAPFDPDAARGDAVDFRLVSNGFVTLFRSRAIFASTTAWLADHGYRIVTVDATAWTTDADLHRELAAALDFPAYYGSNLDALDECLGDVAAYAYGSSRDATGLVLVFEHYNAFATHRPDTAHAVLDSFARRARDAALIGHRMLCLVRSDDPNLRFAPVGATPVAWNDAEWLDGKRRR